MELNEAISIIAAAISIIIFFIVIIVAIKSGIFGYIRFNSNLEINPTQKAIDESRKIISSLFISNTDKREPFETEHLERYYTQVLIQFKIAFWFSLIFASFGFVVIVVAALMYSIEQSGIIIVQGIAGVLVDAIAALFFVQANRTQASMMKFFDKLRKDRQYAESQRLCESIDDRNAKDALRIYLSLYYAGVEKYESIAKDISDAKLNTKVKIH
jgi:hypothetical protein